MNVYNDPAAVPLRYQEEPEHYRYPPAMSRRQNPNNSYRGSHASDTSYSSAPPPHVSSKPPKPPGAANTSYSSRPPKLGSAAANTSYAGSVSSNQSYRGSVSSVPGGGGSVSGKPPKLGSSKPPALGSQTSANSSFAGSVSGKPPAWGTPLANSSIAGSVASNTSYRGSVNLNPAGSSSGKPAKLGSKAGNASFTGSVHSRQSYTENMAVPSSNPPLGEGHHEKNTSLSGSGDLHTPFVPGVNPNPNMSQTGSVVGDRNSSFLKGVNANSSFVSFQPNTSGIHVELQNTTYPGSPSSPVPPSYNSSFRSEKPPAYDNIFGRVQQAKDESTGKIDFAQRVIAIGCVGTLCTLVNLLFLFTIPIINLVIGLVYMNNCPLQVMIPVSIIVSGIAGIVKGVIAMGICCVKKLRSMDEQDAMEEDEQRTNGVPTHSTSSQTHIPSNKHHHYIIKKQGLRSRFSEKCDFARESNYLSIFVTRLQSMGDSEETGQLRSMGDQDAMEEDAQDAAARKWCPNPLDLIINIFLVVWFIAGSFWVFSVKEEWQWTNKDGDDFCDEVCYRYTFWFHIIGYIVMFLGIVCGCAGLIVSIMVYNKK